MQYWLVKQEPESYSFEDFMKDSMTIWDGVRSYQARNYLKEMKKGDEVLYYHSGKERKVVGKAVVSREYFQDPSSDEDRWVAVELKANTKLKNSVSLKLIKESKDLKNIALIKQSRLSVIPLSEQEFKHILELSE